MADSDDEYDKKRRDKFRGERTESYRGDGHRNIEDRRRGDWFERDAWSSRSRSRPDYRSSTRERYSPPRSHEISQPVKRPRTEWEDRRSSTYTHDGGSSGYGSSYSAPWPHDAFAVQHSYGFHSAGARNRDMNATSNDTQPPMMSLKAFLQSQDDSITDEEAIKKYNEYKAEFRRQQLNEFFVAHKDEEWFKVKYHPEESVKKKEEHIDNLKSRVSVFMEFLEAGRFDKVTVDADQTDALVRLFDMVTIRLEGGTEFDFKSLETPPQSPKRNVVDTAVVKKDSEATETEVEKLEPDKETEKESDAIESSSVENVTQKDVNGTDITEERESSEAKDETANFAPESPRVKENDIDQVQKKIASPASSGFSSDDSREEQENDMKKVIPKSPKREQEKNDIEKVEQQSRKRKRSESPEHSESNDNDDNIEDIPKPVGTPPKNSEEQSKRRDSQDSHDSKTNKSSDVEEISDKEDSEDEDKKSSGSSSDSEEETKKSNEPKPRPLHKTLSIFLRNIAPTVTKAEIETICKRFPGFLRVAIADPQPERRWFRRGWVTFQGDVDIKDICWNFNNLRLRECEVSPIVNRMLSRRIRSVNGITAHKQVVRQDIKLSSRIIYNLDSRYGLWIENEDKDKNSVQHDAISIKLSKNPLLNNITEYLIEEAPAEEEELLGITDDQEEGQLPDDTSTVDRENSLIKVLDRLLLYLRIVHSIDYYNHCEYPSEDEMPNRCGLMHARGSPPLTKVTNQEIMDYIHNFEQKIAPFLQPFIEVVGEELVELGCKDPEAEVEKFIQSNTQELAKDKWLCPLSGKKFKGPEFVRKHILGKHAEKVEEVRKEVEYFNNYLKDPKRPQLPEHPGNKTAKKEVNERETFTPPVPYMPHYQYGYAPQGGYGHPMYGAYGYGHAYGQMGYGRPNRGFNNRGRPDYRPIIHYRDLDAPREAEDF